MAYPISSTVTDCMHVTTKTNVSLQDWVKAWETGATSWHMTCVNPILELYFNKLLSHYRLNHDVETPIRIFVPFCGKSLDLLWLYNHDCKCEVTGCEFAEQPILEFFEENNMKYQRTKINGELDIFQTMDNRLRIIKGDFFNLTAEICGGRFHAAWDRGALTSQDHNARAAYVNKQVELCARDCSLLLNMREYDPVKDLGPPHHISEEDIENLYGNRFHIQCLEKRDGLYKRFADLGHTWMLECVYFLTSKDL